MIVNHVNKKLAVLLIIAIISSCKVKKPDISKCSKPAFNTHKYRYK